MDAYLLTEEEAFTCFASDALGTLLARCTCDQQSQHKCDECRNVDAIAAERDLTCEEVLYERSRAMARRRMKRRRVDIHAMRAECETQVDDMRRKIEWDGLSDAEKDDIIRTAGF